MNNTHTINTKNIHDNSGQERVAVIGMGYVGFPLACAIARNNKYKVYGLDIDKGKIEKIKNRVSPVRDEQAEKDILEVDINATTDFSVLKESKFIIICVPTPVDHNKNPDLTPVILAARSIAEYIQHGQVIILESTVNPGVSEEVILPILETSGLKGGVDFELAHCPERINPGDPNWNVYNIPRNVGALTKQGAHGVANFYRSFLHAEVREVSTIKTAEATKIVENTFRDINIAYVNELAMLFEKMGIDINEVLDGAANKPFAFMKHSPGCGVGGHCIPVDPYYLIKKARELGFDTQLIRTARNINANMPRYTVGKLIRALHDLDINASEITVGLLGLSYKADSDDMRESPALDIRDELTRLGVKVISHDPYVNGHADATLDKVLSECTALIVATCHSTFPRIRDWKNVKVIIDGRNCLNMHDIMAQGIHYEGIGRRFAQEEKYVDIDELAGGQFLPRGTEGQT